MENGAAMGCISPRAMEWAKTLPDPGVALKPPVPQPQLKNRLLTGVFEISGERSTVTSTMPPHWRSIFMREKMG